MNTNEIVKWINANADNIRIAVIIMIALNLLIIGGAGLAGEFFWIVKMIFRMAFADVGFIVPLVLLVKFFREAN